MLHPLVGQRSRPLGRHLIAPLVFPNPADAVTCNVRPGTKVLVLGAIAECSNVEGAPFHADTYAEAIACAHAWISHLTRHEVVVDGQRPIDLLDGHSATTDYLTAWLPQDNILGAPAQEIRFASFGYGVLLPPLSLGRHAMRIEQDGQAPNPDPVPGAFYMNVNVLPGSESHNRQALRGVLFSTVAARRRGSCRRSLGRTFRAAIR